MIYRTRTALFPYERQLSRTFPSLHIIKTPLLLQINITKDNGEEKRNSSSFDIIVSPVLSTCLEKASNLNYAAA